MKKIINKNLAIFLISLILTIVTFSSLSNNIKANTSNLSDFTLTWELAKFIMDSPDKFMNANVQDIFQLNTIRNVVGGSPLYGLTSGNESANSRIDIWYNSAACIFHAQSSGKDGYKVKIANIIDIETPSLVNVYKFTGTKVDQDKNGTSDYLTNTYTGQTLDFSTPEKTKQIYDKMVNSGIIKQSEVSYSHEGMKKDIAAFAYLAYNSKNEANGEYSEFKNSLHYCWKLPGGIIPIRKYIKASGIIDDYFYNAEGQNFQVNSQGAKRTEAYTEAAKVIAEPKLTKQSTVPNVTYQNGKAYIGPLQVTYSGGIPLLLVNIGGSGENWVNADGWVTKNTNGTFGILQTGNITGNVFYAVIDESKVKNLNEVKTKVVLSYDKYKARILLATNQVSGGQSLMFYTGQKLSDKLEVSWSIEQSKNLTIQKLDANGKAITTAGIEFQVLNEAGGLVGTLTTTTNGKTNTIKVSRNTKYTLKEIKNSMYGYKNASIVDATIAGGTIHSKNLENREIVFSLTQDGTINIKNTPQLGKITINKEDEQGKAKKGVQFVIFQAGNGANGYIKLSNVTQPITTSNDGLNITSYEVTYVANKGNATIFETNESGEIVINNLEIYCGKDSKYLYYIRETENPNYGYNGINISENDITVTGAELLPENTDYPRSKGWILLKINEPATLLKVTNHESLGHAQIKKVNQLDEPVQGVRFIIGVSTNISGVNYMTQMETLSLM